MDSNLNFSSIAILSIDPRLCLTDQLIVYLRVQRLQQNIDEKVNEVRGRELVQ